MRSTYFRILVALLLTFVVSFDCWAEDSTVVFAANVDVNNSSKDTVSSDLVELDRMRKQNEQLQQRSRFTTGGVVMILGIVAMLVFLVANNRWRRERNVVVAQNKQLAIERDRAESALKAKTTFLRSITHEVRTPLNAIGGFSQVLTMSGVDLPESERLDYSQRILENIRLLTNILDDLIWLRSWCVRSCPRLWQ